MTGLLRRGIAGLADLVWPRICAIDGCGRTSDRPGRHICSRCFATLPFLDVPGRCSICGAETAHDVRHEFVCEACTVKPPPFERARSAVRYDDAFGQLMQDFKYRKSTWLRADLSDLLEGVVRAKFPFHEIDVVIPVPLHPNRLRERGFNQCELLAEDLARRLNRRLDAGSLRRVVDTPHQARLSEDERRKNLDSAFDVSDASGIRGRTVLLVDDVMTSGTTLSCTARVLKQAGASRIWCATVARAIRRS